MRRFRLPRVALGLLLLAGVYFDFLRELIPESSPFGLLDEFVVPTLCAFIAGRLLSRIKIKRVPVPGAH